MYSEVIYTRCRQGIDILKNGRPITSDGFKVYSCSKTITDGEDVDLPLLFNMTQGKQSYSDPAFMDDAYLYAVPDKGKKIMVNFHPIPFDRNAKGDYSHRPGNFINQVFVGEFKEFYPYEIFGNNETWDAKDCDEAFYYDTPPQSLAERDELTGTVGSIVSDDIARFVADGRCEAVRTAVAFILEQYSQPPESRKYLVIRDDSSSFLELWVAAIESAFSPRMASGLPFATRMDKFTQVNRYTVNLNGLYQTQMNLQDPKQKQRFRAMIVCVDERDRTNVSLVRPLPNAPYVVLDGKSKKIDYECNTSPAYYSLITAFDERHSTFCREFLQMLDICQPTPEIIKYYESYTKLVGISSSSTAQEIAAGLSVLENQYMLPSPYLSKLYDAIKKALPRFLKENLFYAFTILKWLQKVAPIIGDIQASSSFDSIVSASFAECVYKNPSHKDTAEFWASIRNSSFVEVAANELVKDETFESYSNDTSKYNSDAWISFLLIFLQCADKAHLYTVDGLTKAVSAGLNACISANEREYALKICEMMSKINVKVAEKLLLNLINSPEATSSEDYLWLLLRCDSNITKSDRDAIDFARNLKEQGNISACEYVLSYRADLVNNQRQIKQYFDEVLKESALKGCDFSGIYKTIDSKLQISDKDSVELAFQLQQKKDPALSCPNSAHICALAVLNSKKGQLDIVHEFQSYAKQGFPSVTDERYAEKLVKGILLLKLPYNDLIKIIEVLAQSPIYLRALSHEIIATTNEKNSENWNALIDDIAANKNEIALDIITDECMSVKKSEKHLERMWNLLESPSARNWFSWVLGEARKRWHEESPLSGIGRLFGFGGKKNN